MASRRLSVKQAGPKEAAGKDDQADACPSWVNGIKSIIDVKLEPPAFQPPVNPPVALYLEEVTFGMTGGVGDPKLHSYSQVRKVGGKVTPVDRLQGLLKLTARDNVAKVCHSLFWLVQGGIFGNVPEKAMTPWRVELGEKWYAVTLQAMEDMPGDQELQDAVLACLPFVFAQVMFRLFVDGFLEDRKHLVKEGEILILKASMLSHYELSGFQLTVEAVRRARHRLFLARVLKSPHVDQREFMKGRKRQEILEAHKGDAGEQPLEFGREGAVPLEESQLEHVMHGSEASRRKAAKAISSGKAAWELDTTPVPNELSVERHLGLFCFGAHLESKHMEKLNVVLGEGKGRDDLDSDEESAYTASNFSSVGGSESHSPPGSPSGSPHVRGSRGGQWSPAPPSSLPSPHDAAQSPPDSAKGGEDWDAGGGSPTEENSSKNKRFWRKGLMVAKAGFAKEEARNRKEREAKAKKLRQETLLRNLSEPLPKELSERSFNTTWVSPPMVSLANGKDRTILNKTSAESFQLKMMVKQVPMRPLSMPALTTSGKAPSRRPLEASAGASSAAVLAGAGDSLGSRKTIAGEVNPLAASGTLPRMLSTTLTGSGRATTAPVKGEVISIEPPMRLGNKLIKQRLEAQDKAFHKQSFAIYMKEHDVFSGIKKSSMDEERLRREEDAYVKKMKSLVGGPPKRCLMPESMIARQGSREASGGGGNGS